MRSLFLAGRCPGGAESAAEAAGKWRGCSLLQLYLVTETPQKPKTQHGSKVYTHNMCICVYIYICMLCVYIYTHIIYVYLFKHIIEPFTTQILMFIGVCMHATNHDLHTYASTYIHTSCPQNTIQQAKRRRVISLNPQTQSRFKAE